MSRTQQERLSAEFDGMRVEVTGLTATLRALNAAGAAAEDMKDLMHSTGEIVASAARDRVQVGTGALRDSIRAGRGKTKAVVRAGTSRRTPYAGVQHYGWPARNIEGSMYMVRALNESQSRALTHIEQGLQDLLRKQGLS